MFYSLAPNIRTALRVYSCILLALLAYCLCALNARAQVNDVSTNFNLIGNPYAARYPAPIPVSIRAFATYKSAEFNANQERLYISGGSTNSPTNRGDIWSLNPIDDSFRLEISQGDLEQTGIFRILGNQLYLTNEDDIDFQNFYRLDASGWVRYGSNKAGSGHSYEAYLYDRLIYTLRRGDMRNPNFISSVDNGVTWNINPPVPIGSDEADAGQDTRFFELNNIAYALGSNCPHMLRRFDPRREASLVDIPLCVKDSNGNLTSPFGPGLNLNSAPQVFKRKLVFLGGYGQGLGVISQIEPTLVSQTNIGPANILQYFVQEGVLYTLSPTPSATGYYSVYASTDLSTFSELFRFKPPSSVARPYQFALAGGNFIK